MQSLDAFEAKRDQQRIKYMPRDSKTMSKKKSPGEKLQDEIMFQPKPVGQADHGLLSRSLDFAEGYKEFLENKTEREIVDYTIPILLKSGYSEYVPGKKYSAGDKVFFNNRGKALIMVTVGSKPMSEGLRVGVSHIDSPRLDFKPNPLFESSCLGYFKTHYYGGIKKYQWFAIPLSIRGVVVLKDGKSVTVRLGDLPDEPSFCVTDLLPHLAINQMKKPVSEAFEGEQLNILAGSWPYDDEKAQSKIKLNIMSLLFEKYGLVEEDFLSAELCAVPAFMPRDLGLDRSMVAAYGQDDSVCAYANLMAEIECKDPTYTTVTVFADKEETGSDGATGMRSSFLRDFLEDFLQPHGVEVRHAFRESICFSCDVNAAIDPAFPEVFEPTNCSHMNRGPVVSKYTGSRGKYSTNDASAETMAFVRSILDGAGIPWQVGELGKVDAGGGGTVAAEISVHNMDTVDIGVAVLSMHSPYEVVSKADLYLLYKALLAFYGCPRAKP